MVDVPALTTDVLGKVAVLVPTAVEDLGEAHTALGHAAREQAVVGEGPGFPNVGTISGEDVFGFVGEIG